MGDETEASEHDVVKEGLLIEGLCDWIRLGEVNTTFLFENHIPKRSVAEAQQLTLSIIRELVEEGLFDLGEMVRNTHDGFKPWELPLNEAMAKIKEQLTDKGKDLALKLYHADDA